MEDEKLHSIVPSSSPVRRPRADSLQTSQADKTEQTATLLQAAGMHKLTLVQFASDLLQRASAEENEQLP